MARARINLNRFRKIYPQMGKSPRWFSAELHPYKVSFSNANSAEVTIADFVTPVIVLTPGSDPANPEPSANVNLWVQSIIRSNNGKEWIVTIHASTFWTGEAHVHVGEAFLE